MLFLPDAFNELNKQISGDFYVGGWTAANHWGLLDDLAFDTFVFCIQPQNDLPSDIVVKVTKPFLLFGIAKLGRHTSISDIHKCVIDAMMYPDMFGGNDMLAILTDAYLSHPDRDFGILKSYAKKTMDARIAMAVGEICGENQ